MRVLICQVLVGVMVAGSLPGTANAQGVEQSVQVRSSQVRERPSFLAPVVGELQHGDRVPTGSQQGPWLQIYKNGEPAGWVHSSALTRKRVEIRSGTTTVDSRVSEDELALAGKGFSQEVERTYRARHGNSGFEVLDQMERMKVSHRQIKQFLQEGRLHSGEGGRP